MTRFVALLRGINVGKAKRVAMADLRALLESLGYKDVKTLLNSGNAVFGAHSKPSTTHARNIQRSVANELGVDCVVIVKSAKEIADVVANNVLKNSQADPSRLLVALTSDSKSLLALESAARADWGQEEVHVCKHAAYIWCANGILASKAVAVLSGLGGTGTTRNWSTIQKLHALLRSDA